MMPMMQYARYVAARLTPALAWLGVCAMALLLWLGISVQAQAEIRPINTVYNAAQASRGPAAFPNSNMADFPADPMGAQTRVQRAPSAAIGVESGGSCSDYKRQVEQLKTVIDLQKQKIALLSKRP
jgi:hypothetical protein